MKGSFVSRAKHKQIAWVLAWIYLTLSVVGEGLHGLPGMGHAMHCGQVVLWVGGPVLHCARSHEAPPSGGSLDEPMAAGPMVPDAPCPICSFVAMGKWLAATTQPSLASRLVGVVPMSRNARPDAEPRRGVLARGPPVPSGTSS